MGTDQIVDLLQGRVVGPRRWMSRCPAHADRSPSLSIREGSGGKTLLHCFAGCEVQAIVRAAGLEMADLRGKGMQRGRVIPFPQPCHAQRELLRRQYREVAAAYRSLGRVLDALTERLVCAPEGSREQSDLAAFFHCDLGRLREMEGQMDELNHALTEMR